MLYDTAAQTVAAGGTLTLPANSINSTGSITASGTTGVTLAAGHVPRSTFVSDANVAAAGTLGAALELGGAALPYAVTAETQDAAGADRITLTAIVTAHNGAAADRDKQQRLLEHLHEQHAHRQ